MDSVSQVGTKVAVSALGLWCEQFRYHERPLNRGLGLGV